MSQPLAFITGIAGFAGSFLAEELLGAGYRVAGSLFNNEPTGNIDSFKNELKLYPLDILDASACQALLPRIKPDYVLHLAAIASVGKSFQQERKTIQVNFDGSLNLFEACIGLKGLKSVLFVSSSDVYGKFTPKTKTLTEDQPFAPISPYGLSKAAVENACGYYLKRHRLPVMIARSFTHAGPRQSDDFVISAFAKQIAEIEAGLKPPVLNVGDLSARRDFSDVRDIVRGYRLALEKGTIGQVYQFCSGKAVAIQTIADRLIGRAKRKVRLKVDPARLRKSDIPVLRGNNGKATQQLGYDIRYKLSKTLADTLEYWRGEIGMS